MSAASQTAQALSVFPQTWGGDVAYTPSGGLQTLISGIGAAHALNESQLNYVKLQTRIASATDSNLEQIALDFLGPDSYRSLVNQGNNVFSPETDEQYSLRIRKTITAEQLTVKGMTALLNAWVQTYFVANDILNFQLLGLDLAGGLDTWGALDGTPVDVPPIPVVTVFDLQSDPIRAAKVGLTPGQFCVLLTYGGLLHDGFFVGRVHIGRSDHLLSTSLRSVPPLSAAFDAYVRKIKAVGTTPIYVDNRSS